MYHPKVAVFTILASLLVVVTTVGAAWWLMWKVNKTVIFGCYGGVKMIINFELNSIILILD